MKSKTQASSEELVNKENIKHCMIKHRFRLSRDLDQYKKNKRQQEFGQKLFSDMERSISEAVNRQSSIPKIQYPEELPVVQKREAILEAIREHQVVVLAGETGSGKTTQLPKLCLELGLGVYGMIGHTQPRRLAARSVSQRIADELNVPLGEQVGYQVRFTDKSHPGTLVKLMTDGILLAEIQQDPFLNRYEVIIIDEAHERSLNIDFLMGYLKRLLPKRPDLKVIITSATIDVERFSKHFNRAPIVSVSGRSYPVTVEYRPLMEQKESQDNDELDVELSIQQQIIEVIKEIQSLEKQGKAHPLGDVLVFLSGEREIRETADKLRRASFANTEIMPLYARLSAADQQRVFASHSGRRIVLSTNVAETSLTVPGIRYVIDSGEARISRYSYRSKVQRLPIEPVSQASANQRKGRCGRVSEGICFRLYSEEDFISRDLFTDAEILRTNLASVILQMHHMKLGDINKFPFVDKPDQRFIKDGLTLLQALGAIDDRHQRLTPLGRKLAKLPTDPRLARMILAASELSCLREVMIIASVLSIQDPRERPVDKQQQADEKHRVYVNEDSDFLTFVQLWDAFDEERENLTKSQLRKYCKQQFLSYMRMQEWREIHHQLKLVCKELKLKMNQQVGSYDDIHKALLTGLLDQIGFKNDEGDYLGARQRKFVIFPGSRQAKKKPKWVLAAELTETSRLFARTVAKVDPGWIEPIAKHLSKTKYFEPHWEKKRQQVVAFEQVTLYGLVIVPKRKVNFGRIDPVQAREIFIQSALVEGQINLSASFYEDNLALIQEIEDLEHKSRRRDILVDDQVLYDFYDARLPSSICQTATFKQWLKDAANANSLRMTEEDLMAHSAEGVTMDRFPDEMEHEGVSFPLEYRFDPQHPYDGVMLCAAPSFLYHVPKYRMEWLVPGMLRDKCIALVKSLPKAIRRQLVPVPDYVDKALDHLVAVNEPLTSALAHQLKRQTGLTIADEDWQVETIPNNLRMTIAVVNDDGSVIDADKDLDLLIERNASLGQQQASQLEHSNIECEGLKSWPSQVNQIDEVMEIVQGGMTLKTYPALIDSGAENVGLKLFTEPQYAHEQHLKGLIRLGMIQLQPVLKNFYTQLSPLKKASVYYREQGSTDQLLEDFLYNVVWEVLFSDEEHLPRDAQAFSELCQTKRSLIASVIERKVVLVETVLEKFHGIKKKLKVKTTLDAAYILSDIKKQLENLVYANFMLQVAPSDLENYVRYLTAIEMRLEKYRSQLMKERMWVEDLSDFWQRYHDLSESYRQQKRGEGELQTFRWWIEEYRVSLFAQKLGTKFPISAKRLEKFWQQLKG